MSRPFVTIPAGKFKAQCLKLMDTVHDQNVTMIITKHGKPVAKLTPINAPTLQDSFGCARGTVIIKGDIVAPITEAWEADQ